MSLRTVNITRYITPLREGGSLPALVEADDDGLYVLKFRGAGQGPLVLLSEIVAGEMARALGFPVPELVLALTDRRLAGAEPDPEIQELIRNSEGINLGMDFLPGSLPGAPPVDPGFAADVVWFDALVTNMDRTAKNPNLLTWQNRIWLIDHGASFYGQHGEDAFAESWKRPFPMIRSHVLLPHASSILEAHERLSSAITGEILEKIMALVPDEWLIGPDRSAYVDFILQRVRWGGFAGEAEAVRA